jgi:hypothetical protein
MNCKKNIIFCQVFIGYVIGSSSKVHGLKSSLKCKKRSNPERLHSPKTLDYFVALRLAMTKKLVFLEGSLQPTTTLGG